MPGFRFSNRDGKIYYGSVVVFDVENPTGPDAIQLTPDTAAGSSGQTLTGNVLSNDTAGGSTLVISQFAVPGVGIFLPGATATISGVGSFTMLSTGAWTFIPSGGFSGSAPLISYQVAVGSNIRQSTLSITIAAGASSEVFLVDSSGNFLTDSSGNFLTEFAQAEFQGSFLTASDTTFLTDSSGNFLTFGA